MLSDEVKDLENELSTLRDKNDDLEETITDITIKKTKYRDRLESTADTLAALGIITNTPYAKRMWIEGE
jgi:predicted  nucleic acid-binding Zn-ribbon protein